MAITDVAADNTGDPEPVTPDTEIVPGPRLVVARAPDPDLENPAEELADILGSSSPIPLSDVPETSYVRDPTGIAPIDAVLGGGLVVGSVVAIGGEPGVGKTTALLQMLDGLAMRILYSSGEESVVQVAARARRIDAASPRIMIVAETDLDKILEHARAVRAEVVVVDSIQTLVCSDLGGGPGSPGQVRAGANRLMMFAKATDVSVFLICHVTNDGGLAGPATLRHLVDVVMEMEEGTRCDGDEVILRCTKNRFGPKKIVGYLEMTSTGLVPLESNGSDESELEDER